MGLIKEKKAPKYIEELNRGMCITIKNKDYNDTRMNGDSVFRYLINALLIWMLSYSAMDCAVSSLGITYKKPVTVFFLGIFAFLMAFMHINLISKIIGYLLVLAGFAYMVISLRLVINTGFSHILNVVMENLEEEFMLPIIRRFNLYHDDLEMAVSVCLVVIGLVLALVLNVAISEYMNPVLTLLITFPFVQVGTYIDLPPDRTSIGIYLSGIITVVILRYGRLSNIAVKKKEYRFDVDKKGRKVVLCEYNPEVSSFIGILSVVALLIIGTFVVAIAPENFTVDYKKTIKRSTNTYVREFAIKGIRMFFDTKGQGGMDGGRIGNVGIVRLDYETDLIVTFVPTSADRQYLRNYIGVTYNKDSWDSAHSGIGAYHELIGDYSEGNEANIVNYTANMLKNRYELGRSPGMKSKMTIQIVDGSGMYSYSPYYVDYEGAKDTYLISSDTNIEPETSFYEGVDIWYYPYTDLGLLPLNGYVHGDEILSKYEIRLEKKYYENVVKAGMLEVPEECKEAVDMVIAEYGLSGDDPDLVNKISAMYRSDYEYTLMPGSTPEDEDYVTYFLDGNKKGFCAHFSSATVMIFRELGIPARYVEGYVIDWGEVQDGTVVTEGTRDWVKFGEGYTEDKEGLKVVRTEISDAKAHAWVEIYIQGFGWVPVDVTPPRNADDEYGDTLGGLLSIFGGDGDGGAIVDIATSVLSGGAKVVIIILVLTVILGALFLIIRMMRVRKSLRNSISTDKASKNLISFFLYIKLLLKAYGHEIPSSMIERECVKLFTTTVGINGRDAIVIWETIEKAIYSKSLTEKEEQQCEQVLERLLGEVDKIKKMTPVFRRIVYSVWYGI